MRRLFFEIEERLFYASLNTSTPLRNIKRKYTRIYQKNIDLQGDSETSRCD